MAGEKGPAQGDHCREALPGLPPVGTALIHSSQGSMRIAFLNLEHLNRLSGEMLTVVCTFWLFTLS